MRIDFEEKVLDLSYFTLKLFEEFCLMTDRWTCVFLILELLMQLKIIHVLNILKRNCVNFSGGADKTIRIWQVDTGYCAAVLQGHNDAVTCLSLDRDQHRVISGSLDRTIKVR